MEQLGLESVPMWDAGTIGKGLAYCAMVSAPIISFSVSEALCVHGKIIKSHIVTV